jgi:hypothetical protein
MPPPPITVEHYRLPWRRRVRRFFRRLWRFLASPYLDLRP